MPFLTARYTKYDMRNEKLAPFAETTLLCVCRLYKVFPLCDSDNGHILLEVKCSSQEQWIGRNCRAGSGGGYEWRNNNQRIQFTKWDNRWSKYIFDLIDLYVIPFFHRLRFCCHKSKSLPATLYVEKCSSRRFFAFLVFDENAKEWKYFCSRKKIVSFYFQLMRIVELSSCPQFHAVRGWLGREWPVCPVSNVPSAITLPARRGNHSLNLF